MLKNILGNLKLVLYYVIVITIGLLLKMCELKR
jgi:hypothetical protein